MIPGRIPLGLLVLTGLLASCGGPPSGLERSSKPTRLRPSHFGITLPYPSKLPLLVVDSLPVVTGAERLIPLHLAIDKKGRVKQVVAEAPQDSSFASGLESSFRKIKFIPGARNGRRDSLTVRIVLQIGGSDAPPLVRFPVGLDREVADAELYWAALAVFGVRPASLRSFPSYSYIIRTDRNWRGYDYKVFGVALDSVGDVVDVWPAVTSSPDFNDQIMTAINWGEYEPMTIDGRPVASSNFLVVLLLPNVEYPTQPLNLISEYPGTISDRFRVRLIPDTVGLLAPPIPRREWSTEITEKFFSGMIPDLISGRIRVDTSGICGIDHLSKDHWKARHILAKNSIEKTFFPALDFAGRLRVWDGLLYLKYVDDYAVEIWFDWSNFTKKGAPSDSSNPEQAPLPQTK